MIVYVSKGSRRDFVSRASSAVLKHKTLVISLGIMEERKALQSLRFYAFTFIFTQKLSHEIHDL
jgi:hypothetical protein